MSSRSAMFVLGPEHPLLAGRTGKGVRVGVIDSGIHPTHPHVSGLAGGIAIRDDGTYHGDLLDRLGHGTAVAAAIHEKAPDAEIHVIRVFHETLSTNVEALIRAIEWATGRGLNLVNLSLGTANPENAEPLAAAVGDARTAGVTIISPRTGGDHIWYPGSLTGALGVELDWDCPRDTVRLDIDEQEVAAHASGYPRPIPGVSPDRNLKGISFAVANATGMLARLLEGRSSAVFTDEQIALTTS